MLPNMRRTKQPIWTYQLEIIMNSTILPRQILPKTENMDNIT